MWGYLRFSDSNESLSRRILVDKKRPWSVIVGGFCLALGLSYIFAQPKATPVITIAGGRIQGNVRYSRDGYEFWEFLGIPYAMPPEGPRKFLPPVPVEPWGPEVKPTTRYPPNCAQFNFMVATITGEMDCLYLNVFSRSHGGSEDLEKRKPVLVYIHGGGFMSWGSEMYHAEYIMDRDVVLVVMNYRLGPYGFLNLGDSDPGTQGAKGNMGLLDQNLVLQWVQKNIGYFGGDRNRVTLIGESAGASSAHLHILSPQSRGLFHRAVLQSGGALPAWAFSHYPKQIAVHHAKVLGCSTKTTSDVFHCFNNTDWKKVVLNQRDVLQPLRQRDQFAPSVDQDFLLQPPLDILKSGDFPAIPTMWGVNSGEGGVVVARFEAMPELMPQLDDHWADLVGRLVRSSKRLSSPFIKGLRQVYLAKFSENPEGAKRNLVNLISDGGFFEPMHEAALLHAKRGAPTYLYYFNYTSTTLYPGSYTVLTANIQPDDWVHPFLKVAWVVSVDWMKEFVLGSTLSRRFGISHAEDLYQLWNIYGMGKWFQGKDGEFSRAFVNAIVDFANVTEPLTFRDVVWPSIHDSDLPSKEAEDNLPYMLMDNAERPTIIPEPFAGRRKLMGELAREWVKIT